MEFMYSGDSTASHEGSNLASKKKRSPDCVSMVIEEENTGDAARNAIIIVDSD